MLSAITREAYGARSLPEGLHRRHRQIGSQESEMERALLDLRAGSGRLRETRTQELRPRAQEITAQVGTPKAARAAHRERDQAEHGRNYCCRQKSNAALVF